MTVRSIRLSDDLETAVDFVSRRERIEKSQTLRKLAAMGFERYVADLYAGGHVTLREATALLNTTLREALERFEDMGVRGNVGAADVLAGLEVIRALDEPGRE
ncbi:MAG: hypothetical protein AMXMBFR64_37220 [Myxococcales bacterium]